MKIGPYLMFNGTCRESMAFYKEVFGGELDIVTYAQQMGAQTPPGMGDLVMHARLHNGDFDLMASDARPNTAPQHGDTVDLVVNCDSAQQLDDLYAKLSGGGSTVMAPGDVPWGARFASFKDKLGYSWMLNFAKR